MTQQNIFFLTELPSNGIEITELVFVSQGGDQLPDIFTGFVVIKPSDGPVRPATASLVEIDELIFFRQFFETSERLNKRLSRTTMDH